MRESNSPERMSGAMLFGSRQWRRMPALLAAGVFFARLVSLLSLPIEGLQRYGDVISFRLIFGLPGWPFLNYWVEYPPVFPFIAALLNRVAGSQDHVFTYLFEFLLLLADAGSVYLFARLAGRIFPTEDALARAGVYLLVLVSLPYQWWYFEPLVVFCLLLGLTFLFEGRAIRSGFAFGLGVALKFFPVVALLAAWRRVSWKRIVVMALLSLAPVALMYGGLWLVSPDFTAVSLRAQVSKGSWETVWALLDGNIRTGMFGQLQERLVPVIAVSQYGKPAVVPPLLSLAVFGGIGAYVLSRFRFTSDSPAGCDRQSLALVGFAWTLLMLWSPGWSPQWVLYLLPLVLLTLPDRQAYLLVGVLIMVNLLEWPVLLSRGYFDFLWVTIVLRTLIFIILAGAFYEAMQAKHEPAQVISGEME